MGFAAAGRQPVEIAVRPRDEAVEAGADKDRYRHQWTPRQWPPDPPAKLLNRVPILWGIFSLTLQGVHGLTPGRAALLAREGSRRASHHARIPGHHPVRRELPFQLGGATLEPGQQWCPVAPMSADDHTPRAQPSGLRK